MENALPRLSRRYLELNKFRFWAVIQTVAPSGASAGAAVTPQIEGEPHMRRRSISLIPAMLAKKSLVLVLCCALCAAVFCCGKKKKEEPKQAAAGAPGDIVEIISGDGRFATLATSIDAAGLTGTLKGEGPFTLFAPIDSAFAKLPPGTAESLLQEPPTLKNILLYHVVPGKLSAADLEKIPTAATLLGNLLIVMPMPGGKLMVGNAAVVIADIQAKNGVIHAIDRVLLPPAEP
jgi:uncharacterized surface protein with fasciclin (FAS1) repeats